MYYRATGTAEFVQPDDTTAFKWPWHHFPTRGAEPLDDDIEDPSDEPWSVASRRRKGGTGDGRAQGAIAADRGRVRKVPQLELVLYTSASSDKCQRALRAVQEVLRAFDPAQVNFVVHDLSGNPDAGDEDAVIFTPTLVKRGPGPRTYLIGDLEQPRVLVDLLELNGVRRVGNS